jgi:ribosome-associated protein
MPQEHTHVAAPVTVTPSPADVDILKIARESLEDDKAENLIHYDLTGKSAMFDHMLIASGGSARKVAAMADHVSRALKDASIKSHIDGLPQADWVLVDAGDVIIHLFRPEVRAFYQLEKMWGTIADQKQD